MCVAFNSLTIFYFLYLHLNSRNYLIDKFTTDTKINYEEKNKRFLILLWDFLVTMLMTADVCKPLRLSSFFYLASQSTTKLFLRNKKLHSERIKKHQ